MGGFFSGQFQHILGEINAGDGFQARLGVDEFQSHITGTAAEVEKFLAGLDLGLLNRTFSPGAVLVEAEQMVDAVVSAGDAVEHLVHPPGFVAEPVRIF